MLYNGEHIGDGSPPEVDIAVDPLEGTTLAATRHAERAGRASRCPSAARCSTPARASTWRRWPAAAEIADLLDLDRPLGDTVRLVAERKGTRRARRHRRRARPPAPRGGHRGDPRRRRARAAHPARRRLRRAARGQRRHSPVDLLWGIGGTPEGVISARARSSASAASCSAGCGRATTRSARRAEDAGYDLDRVLTATTSSRGDDVLLLGDRRDRRRRAPGRALRRRGRGDDRVAGHALALGHRAPHPRAPRPHEAAGDRRATR